MKYLIIVIILILIISIIYSHFVIDKTRYYIRNKKIDKNLKIIFISDLHNRNVNKKILDIIDIEKPDIVLFGGDMVDYNIDSSKSFFELVKKIKAKKYYTFGNHENYVEDIDKYIKMVKGQDLVLLNNERVDLTKNINLIGFWSDIDKYVKFKDSVLDKKYITSKIGKIDNKKFNIMLAHNPLEFKAYKDLKVDLVLSGHIHGGIIKLPCVGALLSPTYKFFPRYSDGIYYEDKTKMIVSRGIGYSKHVPIRVFNPGEVVIINLIK